MLFHVIKVREKLILKRLNVFLENKNSISEYGFWKQKKFTTIKQIVHVLQESFEVKEVRFGMHFPYKASLDGDLT